MSENRTHEACDLTRRSLLKKSYVAPTVMILGSMVLSTESKAGGYEKCDSSSLTKRNNGWGNGDQGAPGHSGEHNHAENDKDGRVHLKHGFSNYN